MERRTVSEDMAVSLKEMIEELNRVHASFSSARRGNDCHRFVCPMIAA
jgi:hypothetical protein